MMMIMMMMMIEHCALAVIVYTVSTAFREHSVQLMPKFTYRSALPNLSHGHVIRVTSVAAIYFEVCALCRSSLNL